jgi:hypothetical protein
VFRKQFTELQNACAFAEAIVNTVREPLVVLDQDLRVVAASRSFYRTFKIGPKDTEGKLLYEWATACGIFQGFGRCWKKSCQRTAVIEAGAIEAYEIERDFPGIGRRTMCLNARKVLYETGHAPIFCSASRTSPNVSSWRAKRMISCGRRTYCLKSFSIVSPIASKLSQASL